MRTKYKIKHHVIPSKFHLKAVKTLSLVVDFISDLYSKNTFTDFIFTDFIFCLL